MLIEILRVISHPKETRKPFKEVNPVNIRVKGCLFEGKPYVQAIINSKDQERVPVNFLFDTGSALTIITPKDAG